MSDAPQTPRLLAALFDDAALFPPGEAPMADAVRAHSAHRASWYAELVGPFLCPAARVGELARIADAGGPAAPPGGRGGAPAPIGVIVLVPGAEELASALAAVAAADALVLRGVEVGPRDDVADLVRALDATLPDGVAAALELPLDDDLDARLRVVATTPHRAKLRTGGTTAAAFPSADVLGGALSACVAHGVPFKCTAGLHGAVAHTDPVTGFRHHGYGNIVLAVHAALDGGDAAAGLAEHDPAVVAHALGEMPPHDVAEVRRWFTSFGTCSVDEPVAEAVALGLVAAPVDGVVGPKAAAQVAT